MLFQIAREFVEDRLEFVCNFSCHNLRELALSQRHRFSLSRRCWFVFEPRLLQKHILCLSISSRCSRVHRMPIPRRRFWRSILDLKVWCFRRGLLWSKMSSLAFQGKDNSPGTSPEGSKKYKPEFSRFDLRFSVPAASYYGWWSINGLLLVQDDAHRERFGIVATFRTFDGFAVSGGNGVQHVAKCLAVTQTESFDVRPPGIKEKDRGRLLSIIIRPSQLLSSLDAGYQDFLITALISWCRKSKWITQREREFLNTNFSWNLKWNEFSYWGCIVVEIAISDRNQN